jgi:hypothetical protein
MWVSWEIPPDPPFSKGGMFCCFRKLAGMQSFPAYDPKIAPEYLPPLPKAKKSPPPPFFLPKRGRGGFNDRPKKTPNTSPFTKPRTPPPLPNPKYPPPLPNPKYPPPLPKGAGGIFTVGEGYKPCFHTTPDSGTPPASGAEP